MKKILSVALAFVMVLSLSVCAFAGTVTTDGGTDASDVKVTVNGLATSVTVYSVDVSWGNMIFVYNEGTQGAWDPETHTYGAATGAGWVNNTANITVTNHSNAAVWSTASYEEAVDASISDVVVALGEGAGDRDEIAAGVEGKPTEADKNTYTVTASGTPNGEGTEEVIGTITITIYHSAN